MIDEEVLERACHGALYPLFQAGPGLFSGGGGAPGEDDRRRTWRSTITSRGLSFMGMERGVTELESILAFQRDDGFLPASPGSDSAAVPLAATMLRRLYFMALRHYRDLKSRLAALIEPLERYHDLLYTGRRSNLYLSRPADERVLATDRPVQGVSLDVGFNSVLIQAESDLADISIHCGRTTQKIMVRRTKRAQSLLTKLWNEELQIFCSRQGDRWLAPSVEGVLPMFAGVLRSGQAAEVVLRYLSPGRGFWTPAPLSSIAQEEPGYQPGTIGSGAVYPVVNWLMSFGLYRYGFDQLAEKLSEDTKALIFEHGPWEAYNASTGEGIGRPDDPVTAAIGLCLARAPHQIEGFGHF